MKIKLTNRTFKFIGSNLGAPFIVIFLIMLITAGVGLPLGKVMLANQLAFYSFFALIAGILLQVISYLKGNRQRD